MIVRLVVASTLVVGALFLLASFLVADVHPWSSNALTGLGVTVLLVAPGAWIGGKIQSTLEGVNKAATEAKSAADQARADTQRVSESLEVIQRGIVARQQDELEEQLNLYRTVSEALTRENLLRALRHAIDNDVLSDRLILSSIWETDLFYRYEVGAADSLTVNIETLGGKELSSHEWLAGESAGDFCQRLVEGVRRAGADLGVGLNVPTESLDRLMKLLIDVTQLRSQALLGHQEALRKVVMRDGPFDDDQWYYTETLLIPANQLSYRIEYSRLVETDWEQQLRNRGWHGGDLALTNARALSSRLQRQ